MIKQGYFGSPVLNNKGVDMKIIFAIILVAAVCLFIYLIGRKGDIKKNCNSCINCPIKDCAERKED